MRNLKIIIFYILALNISCEDYLDVVPDNVPTIDHAFLDRTSAEKYLATCYAYMPTLGDPRYDVAMLGSDEWWTIENDFLNNRTGDYRGYKKIKGEQNTNDPIFNYWDGLNGGGAHFQAIRDCNVFLENIHKVGGDLGEIEARQWAAEAKTLKAFYHFNLLRQYGSIPLQRESLPIYAGIEEVRVYRDPFDECVDYIVQLLDEAVPFLPLNVPNVSVDLGRITQPIALALKAQVLVTAASPLFNGNFEFNTMVDNRGVKLFKPEYDQSKWQKAAIACKNAIDTCLLAGHEFYEFTKVGNLSESTKRLMSLRQVVTDKWNKEIIWSQAKNTGEIACRTTWPVFFIEQTGFIGSSDNFVVPTLRMAELFYTGNGVPIEEDNEFDYQNRFDIVSSPADHKYYVSEGYRTTRLNIGRETRYYANLAFDGAVWFGNGRYKDVGQGLQSEQPWVIKTKRGEVSGKKGALSHSITGYYARKHVHFESVATSASSIVVVRSTFPIIRLADVYLLYAEALNESLEAPDSEVYKYIDIVRERAGLKGVMESWQTSSRYPSKPLSKEGMREIIQQERMIELAFEGKRYWDIRRWKTAHLWMNQPIRGLNIDGETPETFNIVRVLFTPEFTTKDYLTPIREYSIRVNRNLIQNPYW